MVKQGPGGAGQFFRLAGVGLRNVIHLSDRSVDLLDGRQLFLRGGCDLGDDVRHSFHRIDNLAECFTRLIDQAGSSLNLAGRILDERLDLLRGRCTAVGPSCELPMQQPQNHDLVHPHVRLRRRR